MTTIFCLAKELEVPIRELEELKIFDFKNASYQRFRRQNKIKGRIRIYNKYYSGAPENQTLELGKNQLERYLRGNIYIVFQNHTRCAMTEQIVRNRDIITYEGRPVSIQCLISKIKLENEN